MFLPASLDRERNPGAGFCVRHEDRSSQRGPRCAGGKFRLGGILSADPLASGAIERVLEAERDAQAAVAACERAGSTVLEAARQQARVIFERAQARTVALHGRAAGKLELCAAALMEERMKSAAEAVKQLSDPNRLGVALERVAARLTTEAADPDVTRG